MKSLWPLLAIVLLLQFETTGMSADATPPEAPQPATIGVSSPAPEIDIQHWVSRGAEGFGQVKDFQADRVYVIEFWATWCGPCVASMPHLAKLQQEYADQDVQIISISDEPLGTVSQFLDLKVRGEEGDQTYRELTAAYNLTTDPDRSVYTDYMHASNQTGIPTAFIVGKTGLIEWFGHPMEMDDALAAVVTDQWDRSAFVTELAERKRREEFRSELASLVRSDKYDEAIKRLEQEYSDDPEQVASLKKSLVMLHYSVVVRSGDAEKTARLTKTLLEEFRSDPHVLFRIGDELHRASRQTSIEDSVIHEVIQRLENTPEFPDGAARSNALFIIGRLQNDIHENEQAIKTLKAARNESDPRFLPYIEDMIQQIESNESANSEDRSPE
ncbi:TlpA disulfide reductase family protein [Bremerella sp. JC770]|uniref:TlpA disulfide reductase family protein n=1 Tax=Bremerella sp. JC770 TaxID=3232137 RepID=UPI00345A8677